MMGAPGGGMPDLASMMAQMGGGGGGGGGLAAMMQQMMQNPQMVRFKNRNKMKNVVKLCHAIKVVIIVIVIRS